MEHRLDRVSLIGFGAAVKRYEHRRPLLLKAAKPLAVFFHPMCFVLYIGSDISLHEIPYKQEAPAFYTQALSKDDAEVAKHFSMSSVLYAGSSESCGCGFQHALLNSGSDMLSFVNDELDEGSRQNMKQLSDYVEQILQKGGQVELYGCWDGDFSDQPLFKEDISYQELNRVGFFLKERAFYKLH